MSLWVIHSLDLFKTWIHSENTAVLLGDAQQFCCGVVGNIFVSKTEQKQTKLFLQYNTILTSLLSSCLNSHLHSLYSGARFRKEVKWKLWVCKPWNEGNSGFSVSKWEVCQTRESRVSQARFWKRGNILRVSYRGNLCCEPNLVGSRFSSVNPELLSVSSPVLKCKWCFNTSFIHSRCKIAFLTEYFCLISSTKI